MTHNETKHTPGPWAFDGDIFGAAVGARHKYVAGRHVTMSTADAARIVACVNACEGMVDAAADIGALVDALDNLEKLARPRSHATPFILDEALREARAALARVGVKA